MFASLETYGLFTPLRERMGKSDMQPLSGGGVGRRPNSSDGACGCGFAPGVAALALLKDRCVSEACAAAAAAVVYARGPKKLASGM